MVSFPVCTHLWRWGGGVSGASWCQYLAPSSELVPFIIRKAKYHLPSVLVLALPTTPSILFSLSQKSHHSYPYRPSLPNIGDGMRKCVASSYVHHHCHSDKICNFHSSERSNFQRESFEGNDLT